MSGMILFGALNLHLSESDLLIGQTEPKMLCLVLKEYHHPMPLYVFG